MMLVSVIIPTYNRYKYLLRAVNSVLAQTYKNIEIIIVDDCSTDSEYNNLEDVYKNEKKVIILRLPINQRSKYNSLHAQGYTRNEGIKISNGEYISFLDDDDLWSNQKLEIQLAVIEKFGKDKYKLCSTNCVIGYGLNMNSYNEIYYKSPFGVLLDNKVYHCVKEDLDKINYIINSSSIIHKSLISLAGYQTLDVYEDYVYWKKCILYTDSLYIDIPLVGYDMGHGHGKQYN